MKLFSLCFMFFMIVGLFSLDVSGEQSGAWTSDNNPYNVVGNITVPEGDSLIIQPGVLINFSGNYSITASGYIKAEGTVSDTISFLSNNRWNEIRFENPSNQSVFDYCKIENATNGIHSINSPVLINHTKFFNNEVAINVFGVGYENPAAVTVRQSKISHCDKQGIFIVENSNTVVDSCDISFCALNNEPHGAIQVSNQSTNGNCEPYITNSHIHDNVWQGITAFDITGNVNIFLHVENNLIERNLTGIYLLYASGYFSNNTIKDNFESGNPNSGAGVMIYGFSEQEIVPIFVFNIVTGNFCGFYITNGGIANLGCIIDDCEDDDGENQIYGNIDETGTTYSVYNASNQDIWAQNNYWDSYDTDDIANTIIDYYDNPQYGEVVYLPIHPQNSSPQNILQEPNNITLYPNPFFSNGKTACYLHFKFTEKNTIKRVKIFNIKGELLYKTNLSKNENRIKLPALSNGVYFSIFEGKKRYVKKFVVLN